MESTICNTGVNVLVIIATLGSRALVPMLRITAKMVVSRNNPTSITEEHMTSSTRNSKPTPMANVWGKSVGRRSAPSANRVPYSCICSCKAGSCVSIRSNPGFMG